MRLCTGIILALEWGSIRRLLVQIMRKFCLIFPSCPVSAFTGPGECFNVPDESKQHIKNGLMGPQP